MTPEQIKSCNKYLANWKGDCWHELTWHSSPYTGENGQGHFTCLCGKFVPIQGTGHEPPDYFTAKGFFALWNKAKESKGWKKFRDHITGNFTAQVDADSLLDNFEYHINPPVFVPEWAKFLGWKESI